MVGSKEPTYFVVIFFFNKDFQVLHSLNFFVATKLMKLSLTLSYGQQ